MKKRNNQIVAEFMDFFQDFPTFTITTETPEYYDGSTELLNKPHDFERFEKIHWGNSSLGYVQLSIKFFGVDEPLFINTFEWYWLNGVGFPPTYRKYSQCREENRLVIRIESNEKEAEYVFTGIPR